MASPASATDLLSCAVAAATAAGRHALHNEHRRGEVASRQAHDVKLNLDQESQQRAEEVIRSAYPSHHILGEEGGAGGDGSQPLWIIDPIDGTVNFSHGLHYWCSSVAVQVEGRVVAGAVYAPVLRDLYAGLAGGPALCNGQPMAVSAVAQLSDALALTGLEKSFVTHSLSLDMVRAISGRVQKTRLLGAAALDLCLIARGQADAFYERAINLWDVAAGGFIAERAGGRAEVLRDLGGYRYRYLCTNGLLHDELRQLLSAFESASEA